MKGTPVKSLQSKNSSLRTQIQKKLQTDKKIDNNKENFKKYNSHMKKANNNNFFSNSNQETFQISSMSKYNCQNFDEFQSMQKNQVHLLINKKVILQYESLENPNFFGFSQWEEFNHKFFNQVEGKYIKNLWKIMRTINYGEALIPSGLIFQVTKFLQLKESNKIENSLKQIFNNFLQLNNLTDRINNFRQLKNYFSLQEIQEGYKRIIKKEKVSSSLKSSICKDTRNKIPEKNVFDRNYQDHKTRNLTKNKQMHKRLLEKQKDPQCHFKPKINQYCSKTLFVQESSRYSRVCHSNQKWISQRFTDNDQTQNFNFKATPFQRSRFQYQSLQEIPGAAQHIDRYKDSEAKKRRLQRYNLRPSQVFRNN